MGYAERMGYDELRQFARDCSGPLEVLPERERVIFVARVAEAPPQFKTLRQLAEELGISPGRVRQIEARAVRKVRRLQNANARKCQHCDGRGWV